MLDSAVYGHHLDVPAAIVAPFLNTDKRMICTLNDIVTIHCALMPKGNGQYMILLQKDLRKKLKVGLGDKIKVQMIKDESEYGMPLPEELAELWSIDPDADKVFHTLTKGKQRTLIHMISQGKRSETRTKKAIAIMEYLKSVNGKIDFKKLHQFIKNYNSL